MRGVAHYADAGFGVGGGGGVVPHGPEGGVGVGEEELGGCVSVVKWWWWDGGEEARGEVGLLDSGLTSTRARDGAPQVLNLLRRVSGSAGTTHFSESHVSCSKSKITTLEVEPPSMG